MANSSELKIVHQHQDWILVYKPAGVNFHSEDQQPGLCQLLEQQRQEKLWPVHRLDKVTSGLVIFARNSDSAAQFQQLFSQREIAKYYLALSADKPKKKQGWIKGDMEKSRGGSWRLARSQQNPAVTQFISSNLKPDNLKLFLVKPHTGKTHQIRVALKSIASAIIGDDRYKGIAADRCYLHAYALQFHWQGQEFSFCQPPLVELDHSGQHWPKRLTQVSKINLAEPWQNF